MTNYIRGIDVSSVQGNVPWAAVAASGIQFCIVKCGNGNDGFDPNFSSNVAGATAAGLKVACYHFVYPLPTTASQPLRDPVKQAQYHFNAANGVLALCDFEWPTQPDWAKWGCSAAQINAWGLAYLAEYSSLSGRPMPIYTYPNFVQTVGLTTEYAGYPLWIASYEATPFIPAPWKSWVLWQNSGGTEKLPNGVPVDGDLALDLSLWDTTVAPAAPPAAPLNPVLVIADPPTSTTKPTPPAPATPAVSPWVSFLNSILSFFKKL
jgi:lysozyme